MNPVLSWILGVAGPLVGAFCMWWLNRAVHRVDALEKRIRDMELHVAKEMPSKEDFREIKRDLESVVTTMHEVRDMVIRLEERQKNA